MAGLEELKEDAAMLDTAGEGPEGAAAPAVAIAPGSGIATPVPDGKPAAGIGGGKKGKKKGKK